MRHSGRFPRTFLVASESDVLMTTTPFGGGTFTGGHVPEPSDQRTRDFDISFFELLKKHVSLQQWGYKQKNMGLQPTKSVAQCNFVELLLSPTQVHKLKTYFPLIIWGLSQWVTVYHNYSLMMLIPFWLLF